MECNSPDFYTVMKHEFQQDGIRAQTNAVEMGRQEFTQGLLLLRHGRDELRGLTGEKIEVPFDF